MPPLMKLTSTLLLLLFSISTLLSQTFYTGFEDGTLEGWTNADGSTQNMSVIIENSNYLTKTSDGSTASQARMSIVNAHENFWAGNYFYNPLGEETLRTVDDIVLRNQNSFDLHIRYGFKGANGYTVVTTNPIIIPANSDWEFYNLGYGVDFSLNSLLNLTILNDTGSLPWEEVMQNMHELFEDVVEFKIFHNPALSYDGVSSAGNLEVESVLSYELLSVDDNLENSVQIFPNPIQEKLQIQSTKFITNLSLYNTQGALLLESKFNATEGILNMSNVSQGVYLLEVTFDTGESVSKKLVKE